MIFDELNSDGICQIIREAHENGVAFLKISSDALVIRFTPVKQSDVVITQGTQSLPQATLSTPEAGGSNLDDEYFERDEKEIAREDEIAELQITDPEEFEDRIARGELVDAGSTDSGHREAIEEN